VRRCPSSGSTQASEAFRLQLGGASGDSAWLLLSGTPGPASFLLGGGRLVPNQDGGLIVAMSSTEALETRWPPGLPTGLQVYAQAYDQGALSNALIMVAR
jgi:hypothetical protein